MYEVKDFSNLLGTPGFSDTLLNNHFKLYGGYVKRTNNVANRLSELASAGTVGAGEYAELKRRFGWEFNGMRLHELYFGNLSNGGSPLEEDSSLHAQIVKDFGSFEAWANEFKSTGGIPGIGWVALGYDKEGGRLFNVWIDEHDTGLLAGGTPLLLMDVFEHAFMVDYGLAKADYIAAFMNAIDWNAVSNRFEG